MPDPPPYERLPVRDRFKLWVLQHKLASAVIAFVAIVTIAAAIGSGDTGGTTAGGPTTTAPTTPPANSPSPVPSATVPNVVGLKAETAQSKLEHAGFEVQRKKRFSHRVAGDVIDITPEKGMSLPQGSVVTVIIAKPIPTLPNVVGLSESAAKSKLKAAGYKVMVKRQESPQSAGTVLSTSPSAGTEKPPGSRVAIVVAKPIPVTPPTPVCDPNYAGGCVPIASDVDCAGGSGNGPAYVEGPVTVVGSDIYGLDADGDGLGCE
jgi:PASTA domain